MATATKERRKTKASGTSLVVGDLKRALAKVSDAVPKKTAKPILLNVLLSGETLSATNLEMRIDATLDCYDGPAVLLPHARLKQIVDQMNDSDTVTLTQDGSSCTVSGGVDGGTVTYRLPTEDPLEFPSGGDPDTTPIAKLPADQFVALMQSVKFATDKESSRYALGGVLLEWTVTDEGGMLSFVGTDGRRMCIAEAEVGQATNAASIIVPRPAADVLCELAKRAETVQLLKTETELVAEVDSTRVRALLVQGKFPRWRDVEPGRTVKPTLIVVDTLLHACRQAAICTSEQSKGVTFTVTDEGLHLTSRSSEAGEASVTCDVVEPGLACTVKLDPVFVVQWLDCKSFDATETIELEAESDVTAVVMRAQNCRCVIMPLAKE